MTKLFFQNSESVKKRIASLTVSLWQGVVWWCLMIRMKRKLLRGSISNFVRIQNMSKNTSRLLRCLYSKELSDDAWWFEWRENYSGVDLQFVAWSAWRWLDGPPATGQQGGSLNAQVPRVPLNFSPLIMLLWSFSWSRRRHTDRASFSYWKMKPRVRRSGHLLYQVLLILLGASHTLDQWFPNFLAKV